MSLTDEVGKSSRELLERRFIGSRFAPHLSRFLRGIGHCVGYY